MPFYGNNNITDEVQLELEKKDYVSKENIILYLSKYYSACPPRRRRYNIMKYMTNLIGEHNFLLDKYLGSYVHCVCSVTDAIFQNLNI